MAENLVEKAKAKAEAAAKLKSTAADKDKRALHSFYFLHSLFTLNDAKNPKNSFNCALNANHFHQVQAGHSRTRTRTILRLIVCGMLAY